MPIPLVLVPGLGSDRTVWQRTIDALGGDTDCIVADTSADNSIAGMAVRLLANAPPTFALAGLSMGGMVALEVMRREPQRVDRLALVDTTANPDTPKRKRARRVNAIAVRLAKAMGAFRMLAKASLKSLVAPNATNEVREALVAMSVRTGPDLYLRQNEAVVNRADLRPILATIRVPTLVIVGDADTMTPLTVAEDLARSIRGATLRVVTDCGHLPPIEKPAIVAELLRDWLATPSVC